MTKFWVDVLQKAFNTPEWKEYIEKTSQSTNFLSGKAFADYAAKDEERTRKVFDEAGWLLK
jgi:tripartite-type tricarboxylate transporter receptor subunit TctC